MSKPPKRCIFCGSTGVTKEHVWPKWLDAHLPKRMLNHETFSEIIHPSHSDVRVKKRAGDPQSGRVRVVCARCNNGWMSNLQNRAKPILLSLIVGEPILLHRNALTTLASWSAMLVMVSEYFMDKSGTHIGVQQADRTWLMESGTAPKGWKIWIADYSRGNWVGHLVHTTVPIRGEGHEPEIRADGQVIPNTQTTSFVVGKLYVHALSSAIRGIVQRQEIRGIVQRQEMNSFGVIPRIWPMRESPIYWPPTRPINDAEADGIASAFIRRARQVPPAAAL